MPRIAVIDKDLCQPKKCGYTCKKFCPKNRTGIETIKIDENTYPNIIEIFCVGCGLCVKKCPFKAITIVNLPDKLTKDLVHQYGINAFRLYRLPYLVKGKVIGCIGKNALGKSTAINILAGQLIPNFGEFNKKIELKDITNFFRGTLIQQHFNELFNNSLKVSYKPQYISNIPRIIKGKVFEILKKISNNEEKMSFIINALELKNILDREISMLSGGELQRVAIAACLLKDANIYFLDEPSSFLDIKQRFNAAKVIREFTLDKKTLVCDHDLAVMDYLSDIVFIFYGEGSVYGVVSGPYGVREGINIFIEGYIPTENLRFRKEKITFDIKPPTLPISKGEEKLAWPEMKKTYPGFSLNIKSGEVYRGEVIGLIGPNGIGKTTLIKILAGIEKTDENISLPIKNISYKPQYPIAIDSIVSDAIKEAAKEEYNSPLVQSEIIDKLNLEKLMDKKINELSGGELQKVSIAICLSRKADVYLLDEPSAYLDVEERYAVTKLIKRITSIRNSYSFVVDHDLMVIDFVSTRLIVFSGEPGVYGIANPPTSLRDGMNNFLKEIGVTFRRDPSTLRPRANKLNSQIDKYQKSIGEYYYVTPEEYTIKEE
ncbi:MAG: ribosome biogenesis/translation initiation ATPase RLI [Nitrososphaerota archaeon]